ncbi:MAG: gamma-glutamyl-phosphate reductase, partial [Candidatus Omnitrophica bacterium]|nr:gamma-glutamyl-phosphate reductase [Candidatus Omnitrophota bacterium]
MKNYLEKLLKQAKAASFKLAGLTTAQKNRALKNMAKALLANRKFILNQNKKDLVRASADKEKSQFIDRLSLNNKRIKEMSDSLLAVAALQDPVGRVFYQNVRPNRIKIQKIRVPVGVVLIVYEARPNVTSDCIGLLFKSSNVGILRGSKGAFYSN